MCELVDNVMLRVRVLCCSQCHSARVSAWQACSEEPVVARVVSVRGRPQSKWPPFPLSTLEMQKRGTQYLRMPGAQGRGELQWCALVWTCRSKGCICCTSACLVVCNGGGSCSVGCALVRVGRHVISGATCVCKSLNHMALLTRTDANMSRPWNKILSRTRRRRRVLQTLGMSLSRTRTAVHVCASP